MIRSVVSLARRLAGSPGRLLHGFAVLAVLAAATLSGTAPSGARTAGSACPVAGPVLAALSGVAPATEARRTVGTRTVLDRAGICAVDAEAPADLGLPRMPAAAARPERGAAARFRPVPDEIRASATGGSPLRPPRAV